ncbi:hypothetical protein K1513_06590 [Bifidobacterium catenulatum]|nr:hypothetical protein [Bifidobacterium catenulatum]
MPQSPNHGVSQIAIVYRNRTAWRTGPSRALAPIRHPTCVADVGSVVAARVQSAPLAAQEVNLGVPRPSTGSPQPALTKEATCTLEVTGLTNDPPIPVPAVAEKMHSFAQYMETSSTRSFIDSRQSHADAPLSKFAALATTVAANNRYESTKEGQQ